MVIKQLQHIFWIQPEFLMCCACACTLNTKYARLHNAPQSIAVLPAAMLSCIDHKVVLFTTRLFTDPISPESDSNPALVHVTSSPMTVSQVH